MFWTLVLKPVFHFLILILIQPCGLDAMINPILEIKKQKFQEMWQRL